MSIKNLFPTPVYREPSGLGAKFLQDLGRECRAFREIDDAGQAWSRQNYIQGYTSYSSVTDLPFRSTTFDRLRARIDRHVARFARHLELDLRGGKLAMGACWINIMGPACHHSFHLHPLSAISGTFFVELPPGSGAFKIEDPRLPAFMGGPPRREPCAERNRRFVSIRPQPGDILLFESWVKHEVPANRGRGERVSISFNYDWA